MPTPQSELEEKGSDDIWLALDGSTKSALRCQRQLWPHVQYLTIFVAAVWWTLQEYTYYILSPILCYARCVHCAYTHTHSQEKRVELRHRNTINRMCVLKSTSGECIVLRMCLRFNVYLLSIVGFFLPSLHSYLCVCVSVLFLLNFSACIYPTTRLSRALLL